jgi:membrane associated rhomboid family serine protease
MRLSGRKLSFYTQHWTQRHRVVLLSLIGANIVAFFAQIFLEAWQPGIIHEYLGISDRGVGDAYAWQFATAIFLHDGPWIFTGNIFLLYLLGRDIESILGQRHFLYLYLAGAIGGELGHLFLMPSETVLLAASGGVAAVLVAYATILPELELNALIFVLPLRIKMKHLSYAAIVIAFLLLCTRRYGMIGHSALIGGCTGGWLYAHLLGFGRPSFLQRFIKRRQVEAERYNHMSPDQLMTEEIDPLLEKITQLGFQGLSKSERKKLLKAREKILEKENAT